MSIIKLFLGLFLFFHRFPGLPGASGGFAVDYSFAPEHRQIAGLPNMLKKCQGLQISVPADIMYGIIITFLRWEWRLCFRYRDSASGIKI
jgi:hypothetical protein